MNTYLRKIIKESDFFFNKKKDDSLNNIIFNVNNFSYEIIGNKLLNIFENFQTYKMKNSFFFQYICSFIMVFQKLKRLFYIYTNLRNAKIYKPNEIIFRDKLKFPEISLKDMQKKVYKYSKFPGISKNNISIKK